METRYFTVKREGCPLRWHYIWWGLGGSIFPIVTLGTPWSVVCIWHGNFEPGGYERTLAELEETS